MLLDCSPAPPSPSSAPQQHEYDITIRYTLETSSQLRQIWWWASREREWWAHSTWMRARASCCFTLFLSVFRIRNFQLETRLRHAWTTWSRENLWNLPYQLTLRRDFAFAEHFLPWYSDIFHDGGYRPGRDISTVRSVVGFGWLSHSLSGYTHWTFVKGKQFPLLLSLFCFVIN